jgi:quinol monooxygenase YgiN
MPEIDREAALQTVITTFETSPGACEDLMDLLRETFETFIRHQPGFVSAALHVNDAQTRIANYSQWRRREDFLAMLRSAEMRRRNREITALCAASSRCSTRSSRPTADPLRSGLPPGLRLRFGGRSGRVGWKGCCRRSASSGSRSSW